MTSTANAAEIERFNALAETWWDSAGPMWPLHRLNAARVPFIRDVALRSLRPGGSASAPLAGLTVLDIGCGAGLLSESLARLGATVTGIDPAERNIAIAMAHAAAQGVEIDYRQGVVEDLPEQTFDVVLNMEVVEHVDNLPQFMRHCCDRVRPQGLHFVATINRNALSWLVAIVGAEYILRWLPRGTHEWRKFVKPGEVSALLEDAGQNVFETRGVAVNPLTRNISVSRFTGVNYMLAAQSLEIAR